MKKGIGYKAQGTRQNRRVLSRHALAGCENCSLEPAAPSGPSLAILSRRSPPVVDGLTKAEAWPRNDGSVDLIRYPRFLTKYMKIGNLFYRTVKKINSCRTVQPFNPKKNQSFSECPQKVSSSGFLPTYEIQAENKRQKI